MADPPGFWLFLPQLRMPFEEVIAKARAAEAAGFEGIALMDHLAAPMLPTAPVFDAITTAAAIVTATTRLKVTHLVLCDAFRHPAVLAKEIATLDRLSGARFELGTGWGSVTAELARFGITSAGPAARARRLGESLQVVSSLLTGDPVSFDGEFFRLAGAQQSPAAMNGAVPILIGGAGAKRTMPLVRAHADWWNAPAYAAARFTQLADLAGPARRSVQLPIGLAATGAAEAATQELAQRRFGSWGGLITGTAAHVADELAQYVTAGAERFFIQFSDFGADETLYRFGDEVIAAWT